MESPKNLNRTDSNAGTGKENQFLNALEKWISICILSRLSTRQKSVAAMRNHDLSAGMIEAFINPVDRQKPYHSRSSNPYHCVDSPLFLLQGQHVEVISNHWGRNHLSVVTDLIGVFQGSCRVNRLTMLLFSQRFALDPGLTARC
ncbi:hypothetical protein, partial [Pseudomonas syringae]